MEDAYTAELLEGKLEQIKKDTREVGFLAIILSVCIFFFGLHNLYLSSKVQKCEDQIQSITNK